jgi:hypothetical protein
LNSIVLLCGGNDSGKTTTCRKFFDGCIANRRENMEFYVKQLRGKLIYGVGADSPQENSQLRTKEFCDVDDVKRDIDKRIRICDAESREQSYILIMPYGMYEDDSRTRLNENCFLEPKRWLEEVRMFRVLPIYLRKTNATHWAQKDELARRICNREIETNKENYDKSREVEEIIIELLF